MRLLYFILFNVLLVSACSKKSNENDFSIVDVVGGGASVPKGNVRLHLHNYVDDTEIDLYNIVYTNAEGRKMKFTTAQLYLSEFELIKLDGTTHSIPSTFILKTQENQVYDMGAIPIGNYKSIRFKIGLPTSVNALPSSYSPLLNHPEMWFGANAQPEGYIFFKLEGTIDTTTNANASSADMKYFHYKIGTSTMNQQITMPNRNYSVVTNQVHYIHMYINLSKMFDGIVLSNDVQLSLLTPAENNSPLAERLAENMNTLFYYEE